MKKFSVARETTDRIRVLSPDALMRQSLGVVERRESEMHDALVAAHSIADPEEKKRQADIARFRIREYEESKKILNELLGRG